MSVSDKQGLTRLGQFLGAHNTEILSTGGTAAALRAAGVKVTDVAQYTGVPEMLGGRVKTIHPKIAGGLLGVLRDPAHVADMARHSIPPIDMVVVNLYPFSNVVASGASFADCIENVDIGGPGMLRAAAKNHATVAAVTDPRQYDVVMDNMTRHGGSTDLALRRMLAAEAFQLSASYDSAVGSWFKAQVRKDGGEPEQAGASGTAPTVATPATTTVAAPSVAATPDTRTYKPALTLKYGCNPHQKPAYVGTINGAPLPFSVVSGTPGYINLLDATNAWQLVREASAATGVPVAASFKHVSPAGVGLGLPLSPQLAAVYDVKGDAASGSPLALAYIRARNADPMSSFGDFAAMSHVVDLPTAMVLKNEVCDGVIAPGFEPAAVEVLKAKKGGSFIVLQADPSATIPEDEFREVGGMVLRQRRNDAAFSPESLQSLVTASKELPEAARLDLLLALATIKYTQSNSVGFSLGGQMIGIGAGQQSRVDCVKLAARKASVWFLRQHPKVLGLPFKAGVKRVDRVNARVRYIEGDMTLSEHAAWVSTMQHEPPALTEADKQEFLRGLGGVSMVSDAFFPFRDSIDAASRVGVKFVAQPGGSVADAGVIAACNDYSMTMAFTNTRLFHH